MSGSQWITKGSQDPPRVNTAHSGMDPPTSITNQETTPTNLPRGQFGGASFSSVEFSFFQMTLVSFKFTKLSSTHIYTQITTIGSI